MLVDYTTFKRILYNTYVIIYSNKHFLATQIVINQVYRDLILYNFLSVYRVIK